MVGNQRIESHNQQQDEGSDLVGAQRGDKIGDAARKKTHLEKGVDGYGGNHIARERIADAIEKAENQRVHPWVMVGPWNHAQNLLKLVDAVGRHNTWILVEIVGEPAEQAAQKGAERRMAADKVRKRRKAGGNARTAAFISVGHVLIAGEQRPVQPFPVAGIGIQKVQQIVKQADKARKDDRHDYETVESACEQLYIVGIIHKHVEGRKDDRGKQRHAVGDLQKIHPAVHMPVEEKYQKVKYKGKDIARLHAGRFHQRPCGDKTLEQVQQ